MEADGDDGMALAGAGDGEAGAGAVADAGEGRKERCADSLSRFDAIGKRSSWTRGWRQLRIPTKLSPFASIWELLLLTLLYSRDTRSAARSQRQVFASRLVSLNLDLKQDCPIKIWPVALRCAWPARAPRLC